VKDLYQKYPVLHPRETITMATKAKLHCSLQQKILHTLTSWCAIYFTWGEKYYTPGSLGSAIVHKIYIATV
jgi:hypothetical protein